MSEQNTNTKADADGFDGGIYATVDKLNADYVNIWNDGATPFFYCWNDGDHGIAIFDTSGVQMGYHATAEAASEADAERLADALADLGMGSLR